MSKTKKITIWALSFVMVIALGLGGFFLMIKTKPSITPDNVAEVKDTGLAIAICVLAYSAGPFPLAYNGLGDVCVLLFYGVIPVCFTYYIQTLSFSLLSFLLSVALGLLSVNILVVNNYRDYVQDKAARKRTTIVLFGRRFGRVFYILNECVAFLLVLPLVLDAPWWILFLFGILFALCFYTTRELLTLEGRALNRTLGHTARNVFLFAAVLSLLFVYVGSSL